MPRIFATPQMDLHDTEVITELTAMRSELQSRLRAPRRWTGGLRTTATARAIQGSNTIEGYTVSDQDALAAVEDEEPLTADERTWAEILGYRRVLTFVLNVATAEDFVADLATGQARRLTNALNPAIDEAQLVEASVARFASYDGRQIPGILYRPRGATAAAPVPAQDAPGAQGQAGGLRTGGFGAMMDEALGPSRLPEPLELVSALEAARAHAGLADRAVPGLGRLVAAVIEDETRKLARYLDLGAL